MTNVHASAIVDPSAQLGVDVEIGPYCVLGPDVRIGDGAKLMSHVVVDGHTNIGEGCNLFPFASIGTQTQDLKYQGGVTSVEIGAGTTIREYVTVNSGTNEGEVTRVGSRCHIMAYSHVAHACSVGDEVIMANCATLAGDVTVEDQVIIGGLSAVHQFVTIGRLCIIGGCTKIVKDCPPFMTIDGNPAKVRGINAIGLKRKKFASEAISAIRACYRILYRRELATAQAVQAIRSEASDCEEVAALLEFIEITSQRGIIK